MVAARVEILSYEISHVLTDKLNVINGHVVDYINRKSNHYLISNA